MRMDDTTRAKFLLYREKVRKLSEKNIRKYNIDYQNRRGKDYEIDHRYTIYDGFINDVDPTMIAHPSNLEIVPKSYNRQKGSVSSITLCELAEDIADCDG